MHLKYLEGPIEGTVVKAQLLADVKTFVKPEALKIELKRPQCREKPAIDWQVDMNQGVT